VLEGRLRFAENQLSAGGDAIGQASGAQLQRHHQRQHQPKPQGPTGLLAALMCPSPPPPPKTAAAAPPSPHQPPFAHASSHWQSSCGGSSATATAAAAAGAHWQGGALAASAAAGSPQRVQVLQTFSPMRFAGSPLAGGSGGVDGGMGAYKQQAPIRGVGVTTGSSSSIQDLVDKLAARHAEAQALLQRLQEQRARRQFAG